MTQSSAKEMDGLDNPVPEIAAVSARSLSPSLPPKTIEVKGTLRGVAIPGRYFAVLIWC
jgi:hypothetical protein